VKVWVHTFSLHLFHPSTCLLDKLLPLSLSELVLLSVIKPFVKSKTVMDQLLMLFQPVKLLTKLLLLLGVLIKLPLTSPS